MAFGDSLDIPKPPNTVRIYFQNINGISKNNWMDWKAATKTIRAKEIDIFGCAETNTTWYETRRKFAQTIVKTQTNQANLSVSCSNEAGATDYQPGGVASCVTGRWAGRVIENFTDTSGLGRWSGHILIGKQQQHIVILTAYRPTKSQGFNTNYQQQWRILRNKGIKNPDPREQMLHDLKSKILEWTDKQYEVILMWDANECLHKPRSPLKRFMEQTNLVIAHTNLPPATYTRGTSCIDYVMTTPRTHLAIIAAGHTSFYDGIWESDHRGLFIDLSASALTHGETPEILTAHPRRLSSNNKGQVFRFIASLEKAKTLPDILQQLRLLEQIDNWNASHHTLFESLDSMFTKTLLTCETQCSLPSNADWHPKLHHCYLIYRYWKLRVAGLKNNINVSTQLLTITTKLQKLNLSVHQDSPHRPLQHQLRRAKENLHEQRRIAVKARQHHLTFRQELLVLEGKKTHASAISTIERAERRARCFRKYHAFTKPPRSANGLSFVIRTNQDGSQTRIQQPTELAETLFQRNRQHFAQADGTPFTRPPLSTELHFSGISSLGVRILAGQDIPDHIPPTSRAILAELKQVRKPLTDRMTLQDMIKGFSKWRESTSTSPSNKHLGIYKTLVQYYNYAEDTKTRNAHDQQNKTISDIAHTALQIQLLLINLAISHTHTLERWKCVHNFFIEKIPGTPLIEKLRVIHIYEADWNLILKFFIAHKLTGIACAENTVTQQQAGGRIGRSSSDMATKTVITHEICRLQQLQGAVIYNDAKACFDRIVENISNLVCLREGLAPKIASLHAQTLQQMRYYIKTQHGCLDKYNGHMLPDPFLGSGQGAGDSMSRWGFVSDAIIRAYDKIAISSPIESPISNAKMQDNIQAFVDDSHGIIIHDAKHQKSLRDTVQHNLQAWEDLLHNVGGKLEISKCCVVCFGQQSNIPNADTSPTNTHNTISIIDHETNTPIALTEATVSDSYKLLGVNIAFDGGSDAQSKLFHKKCENLAVAFNRCRLSAEDTQQGYRSIFLPGAKYGLAACSIPILNLKKSQQIITRAVLPKLGYNRHFPTPVVYAPTKFGGIGLQDMAIEQGIAHATFVIGHLRANTDIATSLYILLESHMVMTGTTISPLQDTTTYNHVAAPWLDTLRSFLHRTNSHITTPNLRCPSLLRTNDQSIMNVAITLGLTTNQLDQVNRCRIWLQVITLAEITDIDGVEILTCAIHGNSDTNNTPTLWTISQSKFRWPLQQKPNRPAWRLWQKMLRSLSPRDGTSPASLRTPLGQWHPSAHLQRQWSFLRNTNNTVIQQQLCDGSTKEYSIPRRTTRSHQPYYLRPTALNREEFRFAVTPSTIQDNCIEVVRRHHAPTGISLECPPTPPFIPTPNPTRTAMPGTNMASPHRTYLICLHTVHNHEHQKFSWTVSHTHATTLSKGPVQQLFSRLCAPFRGGLIGLLQAASYIEQHTKTKQEAPTTSTRLIICSRDPKVISTLRRTKHKHKTARSMLTPESELISELTTTLSHFQHVRTHLSTRHDPALSSERVALDLCIAHVQDCKHPTPTPYRTKGQATIWLNQHEISQDAEGELRAAAGSIDLHQFLQRKYKWHDSTLEYIDWHVHGQSLQILPPNQRKTITQMIHGWLPVNAHPGRAQHSTLQHCPTCPEQSETQAHFLQCPQHNTKWEAFIATIACPNTTNNILLHILAWALTHCRVQHKPFPDSTTEFPPHMIHPKYTKLVNEQNKIGWNQILTGRWSTQWVHHLDTIHDGKGEKAAIALLTSIWRNFLNTWRDRCDTQHKDDREADKNPTTTLQPIVEALYAQKGNLDVIDQRIFDTPQHTTLHLPQRTLRDWIKRTSDFVKLGLQRTRNRTKSGHLSISHYFRPRTPSTTHQKTPVNPTDREISERHSQPPSRHARENLRPP
jgi:hypothetical protein